MQRSHLPFLALAILLSSGCKKALSDVQDYYPKVSTVSLTANSDGSVSVVGNISSEGDAPIEYAGFCASTSPAPAMQEAQALVDASSGQFSATYSGLDPYATYYFRAWAANKYGYTYGNVLRIDSVAATPVVAPCTPTANTIHLGSGFATESYTMVSAPDEYLGIYEITANSSADYLTYRFGSALGTGVYTTSAYTDPPAGQVHVSFYSGFSSGSLTAGTPVYVNQLSPTSWEITICSAPWSLGGGTLYLTTKFTCHT